MTNQDLANLIFPNIDQTIQDYNNLYPSRNLDLKSAVTRFAPSPTGFIHIGNFMSAVIDYILARNTNGIFYLRNEDTDKSRELNDAVDVIMQTLTYYHMNPDEYEYHDITVGNYGPYIQSERRNIYHTFIKYLIEIGRAYPCFCTKDELENLRHQQEHDKVRTGYYSKYARCRDLSIAEIIKRIQNNEPYVIRFRSMGDFDKKINFDDLVKGHLELPQNDQDLVIMKSDNLLPTYHFAHVVDDYLMKTTHVVRGEDWLSSVPAHLELFSAFSFKAPKYIHTPLIMKKDGESVRKISKRKDPEASMSYYQERGYPYICVIESLMTIINSNFEQWRMANPDKSFLEFPFTPKKMSNSGAFYDLDKLNNISRNYISKLSARDVYDMTLEWATTYDLSFATLMKKYPKYTTDIFNIERVQKKPRKDYEMFSTIKDQIWYMFDELFIGDITYEFNGITDLDEIKSILTLYISKYYDESDDQETWFNKIKDLSNTLGYASEVKLYKEHEHEYKGHVGDISMVLRVALTSKSMTPNLYEIMKLMGKNRIIDRFNLLINKNN